MLLLDIIDHARTGHLNLLDDVRQVADDVLGGDDDANLARPRTPKAEAVVGRLNVDGVCVARLTEKALRDFQT